MSILLGDDLLDGGRDEDVALLKDEVLPALIRLGGGEPDDRLVLNVVVFELLRVDAVRVVDGAVVLDDADARRPGAVEVAHRVQADVTETLAYKTRVFYHYFSPKS